MRDSAAVRLARRASLVGVTTALLVPGLFMVPSLDSAVFLLVGIRIRDGGMPYLDIWDHKPPGTYILLALSQLALPVLDPWLLAWLLSAVFTGTAVLLLDRVLRRRGTPGRSWAWSIACAVLMAAFPTAGGGGRTESFAVLPIVAALAIVAERPGSRRGVIGVGLLLSLACLFSLFALPAAAAIGLAAVVARAPSPGGGSLEGEAGGGRQRPGDPALIALLVVGGAVLPLLVAAWLVARGAASDAFDQLIAYTGAYRASSRDLGFWLLEPSIECFVFLPFVVVGLTRLRARIRGGDTIGSASALWLVLFSAMVVYDGRFYSHYVLLVVPALGILALDGWGARTTARPAAGPAVTGRSRTSPLTPTPALVASGLASGDGFARRMSLALGRAAWIGPAVISVAFLIWLSAVRIGNAATDSTLTNEAAAYLRTATADGARIFVWGDGPAVYLAADRTPACRFVYQLPMVTPGYWNAEATAVVLRAWQASPPVAIVAGRGGVPLVRPAGWQAPANADGRVYDSLDPLREFVRSHYRLGAAFGEADNEVDVYTLNASP